MPWPTTALERILAAAVGGAVGGLLSFVWLLFSIGWSWLLAIPPLIGAVVGYSRGDRGIRALLRIVSLG